MAMVSPMQMLLAGFTLLLAFPFATSNTIATTSKEEIKCDTCTPVNYSSPPPPLAVDCPPPPSPPSPPPPSPPPPQSQSPPPPACPGCPPPCSTCQPPCSLCPPPPCNACQIPNTPVPGPPRPTPRDQPGVMGGAVYSPPNEVVPYFPYSFQNPPPSESAASSTHLELKLVVSIIFLLLSATFSFF
ncbi:hypothetical protein CRYUN_Cryun14cG0081400 [Craigia yunnanensis]